MYRQLYWYRLSGLCTYNMLVCVCSMNRADLQDHLGEQALLHLQKEEKKRGNFPVRIFPKQLYVFQSSAGLNLCMKYCVKLQTMI